MDLTVVTATVAHLIGVLLPRVLVDLLIAGTLPLTEQPVLAVVLDVVPRIGHGRIQIHQLPRDTQAVAEELRLEVLTLLLVRVLRALEVEEAL